MVATPGEEPSETGPWLCSQTRRGFVKSKRSIFGVVAAAALASATWMAAAPSASGDPGQVPNVTI